MRSVFGRIGCCCSSSVGGERWLRGRCSGEDLRCASKGDKRRRQQRLADEGFCSHPREHRGTGRQDLHSKRQCVFRSEEADASSLSDRIRAAIKGSHGFEPQVLLLESEEVERAVRSNPFPEAESEPKTLHVYFLASIPKDPDFGALDGIKSDRERFVLEEGVLYLHAPDGIGRSRLAANAEKLLGVPMTGRNWRTVQKIMAMTQRRG